MKRSLQNTGLAPIDIVSEEIVSAVLSSTYLNKNTLLPTIKAIIKIFYHKSITPKNGDKKSKTDSYVMMLHKKEYEQRYWKQLCKELLPEDKMKDHYAELDRQLKGVG